MSTEGTIRKFETGATRDTEEGKIDPEGFMHPAVLEQFCLYMMENQIQSDGTKRASDNWQKGIPLDSYMKSLWRHFLDVWKYHRGMSSRDGIIKALCGVMFNTMGYMLELLKPNECSVQQHEISKVPRMP